MITAPHIHVHTGTTPYIALKPPRSQNFHLKPIKTLFSFRLQGIDIWKLFSDRLVHFKKNDELSCAHSTNDRWKQNGANDPRHQKYPGHAMLLQLMGHTCPRYDVIIAYVERHIQSV